MMEEPLKITPKSMADAKWFNNVMFLNAAKKTSDYENDPEKEKRLKQGLCKYCYYFLNSVMAGSAITQRECAICDKVMTFPSTHTDIVCPDCAAEKNICKHCSQEMD